MHGSCASASARAQNRLALLLSIGHGGSHLAKPNYAFAKRQKDLAKKQKKEAKRQKKAEANQPAATPEAAEAPAGEKSVAGEV